MGDSNGLLSRFTQAVFIRADSWVNRVTGLGTDRDKRTFTQAELEVIPYEQLETLYRSSAIHARVVDLLPDEAFRAGFEIRIPGEAESAQAMNSQLAELQAARHLGEAYRLARLYGGGLVTVTARDGRRANQPVDLDNLQRVVALNHFSSREAWAYDYYGDMERENFGQVATYILSPLFSGAVAMGSEWTSMIHASRTLRFEGVIGERHVCQGNMGWPDSILQRIHETVRDWAAGYGSAAHLLHDASQGVYKMPELTKLLVANRMDTVLQKIAAIDHAKSVLRAIVLSDGESYERKDTTFSGIGDTLQRLDFQLAAVIGFPVTVLLGQAPAGLNATGSADIEMFRAVAQAEQRKKIQPELERVVRLLFRAKSGPTSGREPAKWSVVWRPLSVPTDKEKADTRLVHAQTARQHIESGVLSANAVARSMFGGEEYSAEITVDPEDLELLPEPGPEEEEEPGLPAPADLPRLPPGAPVPASGQPASATALNGAQVESALAIVGQVARRELPRQAAIGMLMAFFRVGTQEAEGILGEVGRSFFVEVPEGEAPAEPAPRGDDAGEHMGLLLEELRHGRRAEADVVRRASKLLGLTRKQARALVRDMLNRRGRRVLKPTRSMGDASNFPISGANEKVSLGTSRWKAFDVAYAVELRDQWPEIWARAGNTLGNRQFRRLLPVASGEGVPTSGSEDRAIRLREAWAARHDGDKRLSGIVTQVKWLVVGGLGEQGMKDMLEREKQRLRAQRGAKGR